MEKSPAGRSTRSYANPLSPHGTSLRTLQDSSSAYPSSCSFRWISFSRSSGVDTAEVGALARRFSHTSRGKTMLGEPALVEIRIRPSSVSNRSRLSTFTSCIVGDCTIKNGSFLIGRTRIIDRRERPDPGPLPAGPGLDLQPVSYSYPATDARRFPLLRHSLD